MRILATFAALSLIGSTFVPPVASPVLSEDVRLAWKFKEGDVLRYRIVQDTHQTISGPGEFEIESSVAQVIREKVKSISPEGVAAIECTWEAVKMHMSLPMGGDMDFDSTQGGTAGNVPGPLKGFTNLPGSTFEMEMKPSGELASLHGISDVMKKVFEGDDPSSKMMKEMMGRSFNDETMKRSLETAVLPENPVAVGGTWARDTEFDMPALGKLKAHFDFTLAGMEDMQGTPCAKVDTKFDMKSGGGKPDVSSMPGAENFDIDLTVDDASGEGTIHFSPEKGRMVHSTILTDMDMSMTMKPKNQDKGDEGKMEMAIKVNLKATMSLLGVDDPAFEPAPKKETKDPKEKK